MTEIQLTGSNTRNNGHFVDAGTVIQIGDEPEQISASRAATIVDEKRAMDVASATGDADSAGATAQNG